MDKEHDIMKIGIIGLGYVGLVTSAVLANQGNSVFCVDTDREKVRNLTEGKVPIYEPDLLEYIVKNKKRMLFSSDYGELGSADCAFVCVPTPTVNGRIDTTFVEQCCKELARVNPACTAVIKSTVVPGTARSVMYKTGLDVISNPEFTREGSAIQDTDRPDRIVVGGRDTSLVEGIWSFTGSPVIRTTNENAELIKYASNAFLATKISFINEIANLCEKIHRGDVEVIAKGMGLDKRISPYFLKAGIGYGGSCFPKDTQALLSFARDMEVDLKIVSSTISVNYSRDAHAADLIERETSGSKKKVCILGLSFKDSTDDIRESKALLLASEMVKRGYSVITYDPVVKYTPSGTASSESMEDCVSKSEVVVIAGEWEQFRMLESMNVGKPIIDLKRVLDPSKFSKYRGVGLWHD